MKYIIIPIFTLFVYLFDAIIKMMFVLIMLATVIIKSLLSFLWNPVEFTNTVKELYSKRLHFGNKLIDKLHSNVNFLLDYMLKFL